MSSYEILKGILDEIKGINTRLDGIESDLKETKLNTEEAKRSADEARKCAEEAKKCAEEAKEKAEIAIQSAESARLACMRVQVEIDDKVSPCIKIIGEAHQETNRHVNESIHLASDVKACLENHDLRLIALEFDKKHPEIKAS